MRVMMRMRVMMMMRRRRRTMSRVAMERWLAFTRKGGMDQRRPRRRRGTTGRHITTTNTLKWRGRMMRMMAMRRWRRVVMAMVRMRMERMRMVMRMMERGGRGA